MLDALGQLCYVLARHPHHHHRRWTGSTGSWARGHDLHFESDPEVQINQNLSVSFELANYLPNKFHNPSLKAQAK